MATSTESSPRGLGIEYVEQDVMYFQAIALGTDFGLSSSLCAMTLGQLTRSLRLWSETTSQMPLAEK